MRNTLFQGDPFDPDFLPMARKSTPPPEAALPYVLFSEEGGTKNPVTINSQPANLEWVSMPPYARGFGLMSPQDAVSVPECGICTQFSLRDEMK